MKPSSLIPTILLTLKATINNPRAPQRTLSYWCDQSLWTSKPCNIEGWDTAKSCTSKEVQIAFFTSGLLMTYVFLYSKEHHLPRLPYTWSNASKHTGVFGNLPQGFLFPGSLGVPAGQHTNKTSINIMHQPAEFATGGGEGFYRRFYHRMGDFRADQVSTYEMLTLPIACSYRIFIIIRIIPPLSTP